MTTTTEPTPARAEPTFTPVVTLVLWLGCLLVGALGFAFPYARPRPPAVPAPTVQLELLQVELTRVPAPALARVPPSLPSLPQPPLLLAPAPLPVAPPLVALAQPSPASAITIPIAAPARLAAVPQVAPARAAAAPGSAPVPPRPAPAAGAGSASPAPALAPSPAALVQTLTYGEGAGRQPAPSYPDAARRAGHEGTVVVRFSVGPDGRVLAAEPSAPSPWTALNHEALRVVREQWRFPLGPVRLHEVAIRFELKK